MDKIINWLLQTTETGATYLQAIVLIILLFVLLTTLIVNFKGLFTDFFGGMEHGEEN